MLQLFVKFRFDLIYIKSRESLSFKSIELLAESRILKHEGEYLFLHEGDVLKCLKICEILSLSVCSFILVEKWRLVIHVLLNSFCRPLFQNSET